MEDEILTVKTKPWMQALIVLGVPGLSYVGIFVIWLAFEQNFEPLGQSLLFIVMGLFIIFAVIKGVPLLRFLGHRLILCSNGVEIQKGKFSKILTWEQIGDIKGSDTFQVLRIYDLAGKLVYAVDYKAENFTELTDVINSVYS